LSASRARRCSELPPRVDREGASVFFLRPTLLRRTWNNSILSFFMHRIFSGGYRNILRMIRCRSLKGTRAAGLTIHRASDPDCTCRNTLEILRLTAHLPRRWVNLVNKHVPAPAIANCFMNVPFTFCRIFHFIENGNMMVPGNLCKQFLHNCGIGQASASLRIYFRFRTEKPFISGNSYIRSDESQGRMRD